MTGGLDASICSTSPSFSVGKLGRGTGEAEKEHRGHPFYGGCYTLGGSLSLRGSPIHLLAGPNPNNCGMKAGIYSHECESQGWTSFTEANKNNDPSSHGKEDSHETASWKALLKRTKQVCSHLLVIVGGGGQIGKRLLTQGKLAFSSPKRQLKPLPQTHYAFPGILGDVIEAESQLFLHIFQKSLNRFSTKMQCLKLRMFLEFH